VSRRRDDRAAWVALLALGAALLRRRRVT
jgi:hypothetical protein